MSSTSLLVFRNRTTLVDYLQMKGVVLQRTSQVLTSQDLRKMLETATGLPHEGTESSHSFSAIAIISLSQLAAAQQLVAEEEGPVYVTEEEMRSYMRRMGAVELPNSLFKKKPMLAPSPAPMFHELLHAKVLDCMRIFEDPPKPPPSPRKPRPEPESEDEDKSKKKKKKKKKGKKGKNRSLGKEPSFFNIHEWRQENLPVESTLLFPREPPPSPGPLPQLSPPIPIPEPKSLFTHFLGAIHPKVRQY